MKKIIILALLIGLIPTIFSCGSRNIGADGTETVAVSDTEGKNDMKNKVEQWVAAEIKLTSGKDYGDPVYDVNVDCIFKNTETGTSYTVPAFWDGRRSFVVRYALTEIGDWTWETVCSDNENDGLHGKTGAVSCVEYSGDLDIYKHGFLKSSENNRYFTYADGTPFFYLGDTHWTLPLEDYDGYGKISAEEAEKNGITSMFRYIMDYRAEQGFTVIQTQPLGYYEGITGNSWFGDKNGDIFTYGVNSAMLKKFQQYDKYFKYIAEKGLVNANSQLSYPEELIEEYLKEDTALTDVRLEALCRYWVARYSAYPVMWTTTQEGDNDYYGYGGCTPENNPWIKVFEYVQKYDPYDHPASCHQENTGNTKVDESVFNTLDGYSFYAMQYVSDTASGTDFGFSTIKIYYNTEKRFPIVNFEAHYENYWASPYGARAQAWATYLNGICGFGYGTQPLWSISWGEAGTNDYNDEGEIFHRNQNWLEGLTSPCGASLGNLRKFLERYEWWNLVPCFAGNEYYSPELSDGEKATNYSFATVWNKLYIGYLYDTRSGNIFSGKLKGMENGTYLIKWFSPTRGEFDESLTVTAEITDGEYIVPAKPDGDDWAVVAEFIK